MIVPVSRQDIRALRDHFGPIPRPERAAARPPRRLVGGRMRLSQDRPESILGAAGELIAPAAPNERWRDLGLDSRTLDRISSAELLELMADVSPDVSRALWDFLRICNPGYTAEVLRPSGARAPQAAQQALAAVLATISRRHGDLTIAIGKLFIAAFLRGGFFAELVLDRAGRQTLTLATPDPATLTWKKITDPELGQIDQLGQRQRGEFVALDRPTIVYLPVDPLPGRPDGRSLANPALFPTLFALALLHDVRRVVQQQGWPRLDFVVELEKLLSSMPEGVEPGTDEYSKWVDSVIEAIEGNYAALAPDDAYVHTDVVSVNKPVGAADASSLGAVPQLMEVLERQAVRALKTAPLLMGITDGVSEANAVVQWESYLTGIRSLQHLCENLLEQLFTLALQAQGVAGVVKFRFAEAQLGQRERNAKIDALTIANVREKYRAGWISQDEAAKEGANKEKADVPAPRDSTTSTPTVEPSPTLPGEGEV